MIAAFKHEDSIDIQFAWGSYERDVDYYTRQFGSLTAAMDAAHGMGPERWYRNLSIDEAKARLAKIRKSATRAGFEMKGVI